VYIVLLACPYVPIMLVGVALSAQRRGRLKGVATAVLVPALIGVYLLLASTSPVAPTSLAYRATFAGMVALFAAIWTFGDRWRQNRVTDFFADISYPLYVAHPVLGYALI
jgi:peptidoglycan/LPS O-acetylase OafA/YrhL